MSSAKDIHLGEVEGVCVQEKSFVGVCIKNCTQEKNSQQINLCGLAQDKCCMGKSVCWTGWLVSAWW